MAGPYSAYTVDLSQQNVEAAVLPVDPYSMAAIEIRGTFGSIQITAANEQLAELEYAIRTYLDGIRYPDTPDQQMALNHELNQVIEEEIA